MFDRTISGFGKLESLMKSAYCKEEAKTSSLGDVYRAGGMTRCRSVSISRGPHIKESLPVETCAEHCEVRDFL